MVLGQSFTMWCRMARTLRELGFERQPVDEWLEKLLWRNLELALLECILSGSGIVLYCWFPVQTQEESFQAEGGIDCSRRC